MHASTGGLTLSGRAEIWTGVAPTAPLEQRVTALERNLMSVNKKTVEIQNQIDAEMRTREKAFAQERTSREHADQEILQKLELTETGGLRLSLVGIIWLCCGLILSTIPNEIIRVLF